MKSIDTVEESTDIIYPESDGAPLGENTEQVKWIIALHNGFEALLRTVPDVLLASDLFWYPVKGSPTIVRAPDILIALGRPRGKRGSYCQWREDDVAPQVVWEVRSPSNTDATLAEAFKFYQQYGVEEYYLYDPEFDNLEVWSRDGSRLVPVANVRHFVSPRLGIRFEFGLEHDMRVIGPEGVPFKTYMELLQDNDRQVEYARQARIETEAATRKAAEETRKAAEASRLKDAAFAKLRELGIDPDSLT